MMSPSPYQEDKNNWKSQKNLFNREGLTYICITNLIFDNLAFPGHFPKTASPNLSFFWFLEVIFEPVSKSSWKVTNFSPGYFPCIHKVYKLINFHFFFLFLNCLSLQDSQLRHRRVEENLSFSFPHLQDSIEVSSSLLAERKKREPRTPSQSTWVQHCWLKKRKHNMRDGSQVLLGTKWGLQPRR